jgi:ATP-dependent Lon protease
MRSYTAWRFLTPKQLAQNGLSEAHVQLTEPALLSVVTKYTREAGVRALERAIGGVLRFKAVEWAAHVDAWGPSILTAIPYLFTTVFTHCGRHQCRWRIGQECKTW